MATTGGGDATIVVGRYPNERQRYGTVTTCMKGQLTLQTFSSHQIAYESMSRVWENYIYNALKVRYQNQ